MIVDGVEDSNSLFSSMSRWLKILRELTKGSLAMCSTSISTAVSMVRCKNAPEQLLLKFILDSVEFQIHTPSLKAI